jgi:hypothetical protein
VFLKIVAPINAVVNKSKKLLVKGTCAPPFARASSHKMDLRQPVSTRESEDIRPEFVLYPSIPGPTFSGKNH